MLHTARVVRSKRSGNKQRWRFGQAPTRTAKFTRNPACVKAVHATAKVRAASAPVGVVVNVNTNSPNAGPTNPIPCVIFRVVVRETRFTLISQSAKTPAKTPVIAMANHGSAENCADFASSKPRCCLK